MKRRAKGTYTTAADATGKVYDLESVYLGPGSYEVYVTDPAGRASGATLPIEAGSHLNALDVAVDEVLRMDLTTEDAVNEDAGCAYPCGAEPMGCAGCPERGRRTPPRDKDYYLEHMDEREV